MRNLLIVGSLTLLAGCETASDFQSQTAEEYLQGGWIMGSSQMKDIPSPSTPCVDLIGKPQIEFDFTHTDGRALIYEPYDLFGAGNLIHVQRDADSITITFPKGKQADGPTHRIVSKDILEELPPNGSREYRYYRCAPSPSPLQGNVPKEWLTFLSGTGKSNILFTPLEPGCQGAGCAANPRKFGYMQFEVIGPNHFFTFGHLDGKLAVAWHGKFDQTPIRSISAPDENTLVLEILERKPNADRWIGDDAFFVPFRLTLIRTGNDVTIPEMDRTFRRVESPR